MAVVTVESRPEGTTRRRVPSLTVRILRARRRDHLSVERICRQFGLSRFAVVEILSGREPPGRKVDRVDVRHRSSVEKIYGRGSARLHRIG
jgi:hypothetical protein